MSSLADREKKLLLDLARRALALAAQTGEPLAEQDLPASEILSRPGGAFVTLRIRGRLRGCIGQLSSGIPLVRVVAHCARAAALEDPRFKPVRAEEVPEITIELSVLSELEDITPSRIEPGRHGLVISRGQNRGLLLPQVATEFRWNAQRFLEETCVKGGLEPGAWKDSTTRVQAFTAEVFSESEARFPPGNAILPNGGVVS
jgi:AmmeMemoRadiSam system protein A